MQAPFGEPKFTRNDVEVLEEETVFQGFFQMLKIRLKHKLFSGGWSKEISREVFNRGHAVAAVLYDPALDVIGLVEQFRAGALDSEYGPWCLEVVAGMLESDSTPEETVLKELKEEAGVEPIELIEISEYYSTPGGCSEKVSLFCALCDLSNSGGVHGLDEEDEDIFLHVFSAETVFNGMLKCRTNNSATLIGLQWLQLNRERLKTC